MSEHSIKHDFASNEDLLPDTDSFTASSFDTSQPAMKMNDIHRNQFPALHYILRNETTEEAMPTLSQRGASQEKVEQPDFTDDNYAAEADYVCRDGFQSFGRNLESEGNAGTSLNQPRAFAICQDYSQFPPIPSWHSYGDKSYPWEIAQNSSRYQPFEKACQDEQPREEGLSEWFAGPQTPCEARLFHRTRKPKHSRSKRGRHKFKPEQIEQGSGEAVSELVSPYCGNQEAEQSFDDDGRLIIADEPSPKRQKCELPQPIQFTSTSDEVGTESFDEDVALESSSNIPQSKSFDDESIVDAARQIAHPIIIDQKSFEHPFEKPKEENDEEFVKKGFEIDITVPKELMQATYCKLCDAHLNNPSTARSHYEGKRHAFKENQYIRKIYKEKEVEISRFTCPPNEKRMQNKEIRRSEMERSEVSSRGADGVPQDSSVVHAQSLSSCTVEKEFHCHLCSKSMNSSTQFELHIASKKHNSKERMSKLLEK